ncbi:diadenylate cyclase CdaA [Haploplasma axanthum]|uniref:Diadenylate cyclase n=1 Tax=Haploplasma axanthum TaxID=29552 RepID=A0A449BBA1_HAPAX|nr:diadenylate cyclase CdaA [Haploplasma axanthum]VEU79635.1 membrane protein [Haploplasma axanthum]
MLLAIQIQGYDIWRLLLDTYIIWLLVLLVIKTIFANSRILNFALIFVVLLIARFVTDKLGLKASTPALEYIIEWYPIILIVIMAPDFRRSIEFAWKKDKKKDIAIMGNESTRDAIVDAAFYLSSQRIGALMTIEKHNTLDQFADRAIMMHSNISKELIINIFIPNTPLHDGAVIIRGDEILCAGAYFILSEKEVEDKTMGSRHRAALGISEVTDALTIIVSEETGDVSIAVEGILLKMNDKEKLMEYLSMFMR